MIQASILGAGSTATHRMLDYLELTKPRLTGLVLFTTAVGVWLGLETTGPLGLWAATLLGTAWVAGGANALNEWSERVPDGLMRRTQDRPLPAGRLPPENAYRFGALLVAGGVIVLAVAVNLLTALIATLSALSYVLLYTPLKRRTPLCTLVGAIPGALPPVIGWTAARNALGPEAAALFAILFVWQLPHFLAIAVLHRADYARAGFRMLPVLEPHGAATARQTLLYGLVLLPVSLVPALLGVGGAWYFCGAFLLSGGFLLVAARAAMRRSIAACQTLFQASVVYLPLLLGWLALTKGLGAT